MPRSSATPTNVPSRPFAVNPAGQLTLLGSGFAPSSILTIDTLATAVTFDKPNELTATLPTLSSGLHSITVIAPNQPTRVHPRDGLHDFLTVQL